MELKKEGQNNKDKNQRLFFFLCFSVFVLLHAQPWGGGGDNKLTRFNYKESS